MRTKLLILIAIIGVATLAAIYIANAGKERSSAVPRIIISPATTYIVTPLKPDGHIDYIAAINQKMSEGVTPENNAVVQFWEAVGSGAVDSAIRTPYFKMLGVPAPPQNVHVLAGLRAAVVTSTPVPTTDPANPPAAATIESQLHDAIGRPWSQPEFPQLAAWLTANEKSANAIAQSSQRLRFYSPLVSSGNKSLLIYALLPADGEFSEGARVLAARGMLRLSQGEIEK
ncbi:MAG TPA: hypothetical protein VKB78_04330, partial [Pirellulales bacterium]|nr:hypothetical protein [Pirellulales bacterium]